MSPRRWGPFFLPLLLLVGCKGCGDRPYVPYSIEPSTPAAPSADAAAPAPEDGGAGERSAEVAPPNVSQWTLNGVELTAPAGRVFAMGMVQDFDGDGSKEALAIVRPLDKANDPGELLFYKSKEGPPEVVPAPAEIPTEPSCTGVRRLGMAGKRTAFAELGVACLARAASGASRWIAVMRFDHGPKLQFVAALHDPPAAPKLTIEADGSDLDGDGVADVTLRIAVEGGGAPFEPGPKVSAVLKWLDRSAGLSRDPSATESSFMALASTAMARASRGKDAPVVPNYVAQVRALFRAICPEAGAPRIVGKEPLTCGHSRALEEAGLAEVRAYVTMADPLRAIASLERAPRSPATRTPPRIAEAQGWIAQVAPVTRPRLRATTAAPFVERGRGPQWGPLAFDATGKLLVKTQTGVVRVDPESGEESEAEVHAWKAAVVSPDGAMRWIEAYDPCDGVALRATFAPVKEGEMREMALPVAPPFLKKCGARGEPSAVVPIAWGARGLETLVAGEPLLIAPDLLRATPLATMLDQAPGAGSPRSNGARSFAVATPQGVLVRGATSALLKDMDGASHCTASEDGRRVACVRGAKAIIASF